MQEATSDIFNDIQAIANKISNIFPEAKIYLFGSYAAGEQRPDSDIDICVVVPSFPMRQIETIHFLRDVVSDLTRLPFDILAFAADDFERRAKMKPTIQYTIAHKGVLLYG